MPFLQFKGYILIASAAILYGLIGIFIKLTGYMPLGSINFYRMLFGFFFILLYLSSRGRINELKLKKKKGYLLLLGLLEAGAIFAYFIAVRYTTVSIAVLLLYTAPVYVTLLSPLLLKEKITRRSLLALGLSITGAVMVIQPVTSGYDGLNFIGIAMGLISGVLYAIMILTSRYIKDYYSGAAQTAWSIIMNLVVFSAFVTAAPPATVMENLPLLVLFGLLPTAIGSMLYFNGIGLIGAQSASIMALIEPVSAVLFAFIILGEPVSPGTFVGGAFILLGAILVINQ
jgi:drug/metabolite transporter (DMT)-like permease